MKKFFKKLLNCLTLPYYRLATLRFERKLRKRIEEYKKSLITKKDVEFLKSIGVETDLETLKNGGKHAKKNKK